MLYPHFDLTFPNFCSSVIPLFIFEGVLNKERNLWQNKDLWLRSHEYINMFTRAEGIPRRKNFPLWTLWHLNSREYEGFLKNEWEIMEFPKSYTLGVRVSAKTRKVNWMKIKHLFSCQCFELKAVCKGNARLFDIHSTDFLIFLLFCFGWRFS